MRDIERFLIQPKGSNLVVDESQPTFILYENVKEWPCYDDFFDYYEKYYYRSIRQEKIDKFLEHLPWILGLVVGLLVIFTHSIISLITGEDMPTWVVILSYPVGIAVGVCVYRLLLKAIPFFKMRSSRRYDARVERMSQISLHTNDFKEIEERIQYYVIIYFEQLYYWANSWGINTNFYSRYFNRLNRLQGLEYERSIAGGIRRYRKRRDFDREDTKYRLIACIIGAIIGAIFGLFGWLSEDWPPFSILEFAIGGFLFVAFFLFTPNPDR